MFNISNKSQNLEYQEKLFLNLLKKLPATDQKNIQQALLVAHEQHEGQLRKEGTPYLLHPIRMAIYLMKRLKIIDPDFIAAALLHDTIEDGYITAEELSKLFNEKVVSLVEALTREKPEDETEEQKWINKPKRFLKLLEQDKDVLLIKAVDLFDNLKCWIYIPKDNPAAIKIARWKSEAEEYYLKVAAKADKRTYKDIKKALPRVFRKIRKIHGL